MDDKQKIYYQEIIEENPLPVEDEMVTFGESQSTSGGEFSPTTIKAQPFPSRRIAHEVIGVALNTKSRKIQQGFEFTQSGSLQIGKYTNGISGDIKISPTGIVARNQSGTTTFAIDGDTGDATFLGTIQAGTVIATEIDGDLITAGTISTDKLSANYIEVGGADADLQTTGIDGAVNVGSANVKIDGANTRIVINDGTNDRILIGYQSAGF